MLSTVKLLTRYIYELIYCADTQGDPDYSSAQSADVAASEALAAGCEADAASDAEGPAAEAVNCGADA